MSGVSEVISEHLSNLRFEDIPDAAIEATRRSLLDALAVSLGATGLEASVLPFIAQAETQNGAGACEIIGYPHRVPAQMAAFANGALAHALDFEDAYDAAPMHPNAPLIPAVLAIAQEVGDVPGDVLLTAIAAGCDLACRLGLSVITPAEKGGWYPPPIYAGFGSIAGAGIVRGLTAAQHRDALSIGLSQITCSGEIKYNPQSSFRAVRDAFPAMGAVTAVQMAYRGVTGFEKPLEGECGFFRLYVAGDYSPDALVDGIGENFKGEDVSFKAWPCCRGTHAFIEAALELRAEIPDLDQIESMELEGGPILEMLAYPEAQKKAPTVAIDAKFSLYFTTAAALQHGAVTLATFERSRLNDERLRSLANRMTYKGNGKTDAKDASSGRLTIHLKDGRRLEKLVCHPLGSLENPISRDALIEKAIACGAVARAPVSAQRMRELADLIWKLEDQPEAARSIFDIIRS